MYKKGIYEIVANEALTSAVYRMVLRGDTQWITAAGQFVNVALEGKYLRRPISICDYDDSTITIIYKVVGEGTRMMSQMHSGQQLDLLTGLGNGFSIDNSISAPLLVGGGVGIPPLYNLARKLISSGRKVQVILGFNTASEIFYEKQFRELGADVTVATMDGSAGVRGLVTDALPAAGEFDYLYSCGPIPMLKALAHAVDVPGQFSFDERMGCGFVGCMGCTCKTKYGNKRICREGPVLHSDEIIW